MNNQQTSPTSTLSSQNSTFSSFQSQNHLGSQVSISTLKVTKPASAPPPPPVKPSVAPPPPPVKAPVVNGSSKMSQSMYEKPTEPKSQPERQKSIEADDVVRPLAEFKIDLNTESVSLSVLLYVIYELFKSWFIFQDIPKTGFDFLDNW